MDNAMAKTPLYLQRALVEEIKTITADMLFSAKGEPDPVPMEVYAQTLPIPILEITGESENLGAYDFSNDQLADPVFLCPWCIVKIDSGAIPEINGMQNIQVSICFGIFNEDNKNQGHQEILNLIQKFYYRFSTNPLLDRQYTCSGVFEWALQDEDTYPYFFGAIATEFKFMGYRREIPY
jgi:hypothetical protein